MKAIIKKIIDEASDIKSFQMEPESKMNYIPGQWMYVRLSPELKHHFTISSSPSESFLQITTKFRAESEYKNHLWGMKAGDGVEINGPQGSFVLDERDQTPRLFIAGGIGITPFRSQIKYIRDRNLDLSVTLLYSVKSREEAAFAEELKNYHLIETSREGRLDEGKIIKYCPDWKKRTWWLCGPPVLVEAFFELGQKVGAEKIRSEEFTGY